MYEARRVRINQCQVVAYSMLDTFISSFFHVFYYTIGSVPWKYKVFSYKFLPIFLNPQGTPLFY